MSLNTMMFFIGVSFGATLCSSIAGGSAVDAINPLPNTAAPGFSNAFTALVVPLVVALLLSRVLPSTPHKETRPADSHRWIHDYRLPWTPHLHKTKSKH